LTKLGVQSDDVAVQPKLFAWDWLAATDAGGEGSGSFEGGLKERWGATCRGERPVDGDAHQRPISSRVDTIPAAVCCAFRCKGRTEPEFAAESRRALSRYVGGIVMATGRGGDLRRFDS